MSLLLELSTDGMIAEYFVSSAAYFAALGQVHGEFPIGK